jgi:peroxiredoxin
MRKILLFIFWVVFVSNTNAQKRFVVEGKINKYVGKVFLYFGGKKDSLYSKDGSFRFEGKVGLPVEASISVPSTRDKIGITPFWIDEGKTILDLDTASFNGRFKSLDIRGKILESGRTNKIIEAATIKINLIAAQSIVEEKKNEEVKAFIDNLLQIYPHHIVSTYFLSSNLDLYSKKEVTTLYAGLNPILKKTQYGLKINNQYLKKVDVMVGHKIPEFSQQNQFGKIVSIEDFKGKYVLIDFWASWCIPCRKENPNVVRAYNEFKSKGFDILAVSLDDNKASWLKAIKNDKLEWNHVSDLGGWENVVSKTLKVSEVPSNILIDKDGIVIAKNLKGEDLHKKLAEVMQ